MKTITINRGKLVFGVAIWWLFFVVLSTTRYNPLEILNIVGFLTLSLLPGTLTLIALRLRGLPLWGYIGLAVGFSLLELMLVALIGNTLFPLIGIARPLDSLPLLFGLTILMTALTLSCYLRIKYITLPLNFFSTKRDTILALAPSIFIVMSVLGTIHLNDGGSNIITMTMLGCIGLYISLLIYMSEKMDENVIPTVLFFFALSLLLMTDLRGWYITGHDIQREYKFFELSKTAGYWNITAFNDPYNACLSITILPTVFANLLKVLDQYIFKFFMQIFFALSPVFVYLIGRHWTNRKISLMSGIYFIAFPTFFTDMPFMVRQEIAFVFYGLMLYAIFEKKLSLTMRRLLFVLMGIGVILSHYSTTYTVLLIFVLAVISRPLYIKLFTYLENKQIFKKSSLTFSRENSVFKPKINFIMVGFLLALGFLWTSTITNTAGPIGDVISQTLSAISNGFGGDNRSVDATSLLSLSKLNANQVLQEYITNVINPIRAANPGSFFPEQVYDAFPIVGLSDAAVPITKLGNFFINDLHINIVALLLDLGQVLAKSTEALIPLGMLYLIFRKYIVKHVDDELYLIAFYCLVFVGMNIVLPVLSVQYGIFRAIQQSMFVIATIIVIGSIAVGQALGKGVEFARKLYSQKGAYSPSAARVHRFGYLFASAFSVLFFLYSSAFLPQLFGGNTAFLHLNNAGAYYDDFLIKTQEVYAINWLANLSVENPALINQLQFEVQSDRFSSTHLISISNLSPDNDIFPGVVGVNNFVFLDNANVIEQRGAEVYNGDRISYTYPLAFLDENKNLIYNNGGSRVYR